MWTALRQHGAQPIILDHDIDAIDEQLPNLNAVIMMGNNYDISPDDYENDGNIHAKIPKLGTKEYYKYLKRCEYEKILAQHVIAEKIPLLGVCGGMQRINVTPDPENPELKLAVCMMWSIN
jgi:putative glutamine amidotransferase